MLPLALLALLAMGLPVTIGGWGPREGVAAWAFGAAGMTAAQGVASATVYGVLVIVATLPGAGVLLAQWIGGRTRAAKAEIPHQRSAPVAAYPNAVPRG
jgi:hypothetical protein